MFVGGIYCNQYDPDRIVFFPDHTVSMGSSLIRVHCVCFHAMIWSEVNLNICSRSEKQTVFSGQNYWKDKCYSIYGTTQLNNYFSQKENTCSHIYLDKKL